LVDLLLVVFIFLIVKRSYAKLRFEGVKLEHVDVLGNHSLYNKFWRKIIKGLLHLNLQCIYPTMHLKCEAFELNLMSYLQHDLLDLVKVLINFYLISFFKLLFLQYIAYHLINLGYLVFLFVL